MPSNVGVKVKVGGAPLADSVLDELVDLRIEHDLNLPSYFTLSFEDSDFKMFKEDVFKLGGVVEITMTSVAKVSAVVMNGEITSITADRGMNGGRFLVVSGLDGGHRLSRTLLPKTFLNQSADAVLTTIASRNGLSLSGTTGSTSPSPYRLHAANDYELVSDIARQTGCDWWVEGSTLHVKKVGADGAKVATLKFEEELRSFSLRQNAIDNVTELKLRAWSADTQQAVVGTANMSTGTDGVSTSASVAGTAREKLTSSKFAAKRLMTSTPAKDQSEAASMAKAIAARSIGGQVVARGEALGTPTMKPGVCIGVTGVSAALDGTYKLTRVEHILGSGQTYITRFVSGDVEPTSMVDLLGGAAEPDWGSAGVVIGVVTNNKDPDGHGRVKVKFPTLGDDIDSDWARVASPGASGSHGLHLTPEMNDEVVVTFEHGDLQRPVVIGSVWSSTKKPPLAADVAVSGSDVVTRTWKTRTGHAIEMVDKPGADGKISVLLGDGSAKIVLTSNGVEVTTNGKITVEGKQGVTLKSGAAFDISATGAISIKSSSGDVAVEGMNTKLKGQMMFSAEGGTQMKLKAATLDIDGGVMAKIKAAMVKLN